MVGERSGSSALRVFEAALLVATSLVPLQNRVCISAWLAHTSASFQCGISEFSFCRDESNFHTRIRHAREDGRRARGEGHMRVSRGEGHRRVLIC